MRKLSNMIMVALFCGGITTSALAESFYGALDAVQATVADACSGFPAGLQCEDTAILYRIAAGYRFSPMWGAEASYGDYVYMPALVMGHRVYCQLSGFQLSGTGAIPLGAGFSLIGKAGIAQTTTTIKYSGGWGSVSAKNTNFAYGIGAQYDFSKKFSIRAQFEDLGTVGDVNNWEFKASLLSVGIVFRS